MFLDRKFFYDYLISSGFNIKNIINYPTIRDDFTFKDRKIENYFTFIRVKFKNDNNFTDIKVNIDNLKLYYKNKFRLKKLDNIFS